ncbi:MAG TPA: four helix bundle protein [Anaerolineales bacterium]|nr:four helix bundle protein [Anaerolineales bacterium]
MNTQPPQDLRERTKKYALRVVRLCASLPIGSIPQTIGYQLLRSGTSVGAHYREADRGKSTPDFISKMEGALQELDESAYWMELLVEGEIVPAHRLADLLQETDELISIFVASVKTAKGRK